MKGIDLGTYHLRVEFEDGTGFIQQWATGMRYSQGCADFYPLHARRIAPPWSDEDALFGSMIYQYTDGNYGCDCNRLLFLARAYQQDELDEYECGETIPLLRLTAIRPDGTEHVIWPES